jgi:Kef-type K+ transport system membrane component KefB
MFGRDALALLLLQITLILAVTKLAAAALKRAGQPAVVGEMLAGILLGPSLFGWLLPGAYRIVFPAQGLAALQLVSELGVIVFMLLVGCEFDVSRLRRSARTTIFVSHAGIVVPFVLGIGLSFVVLRDMGPDGARFLPFALFVGTAMSITAFPVLARILAERRLTTTTLGTTAIACAAVDDVTAWCMLSVVAAVATSAGVAGAMLTIVLAALFAVVMFAVIRPLVRRAALDASWRTDGVLAGIVVFGFASAMITESIGVHAIFGAFVAGVVLSANAPLRVLARDHMHGFASAVLVPLFFATAGLRTQLTTLTSARSWLLCALIILVAVAGKLGGGAIAARWSGMPWRDSLALGALMNTRGLMELVVLNVGYDLGLLSPALFSMMVLMAIVTTALTSPLLVLFVGRPVAGRSADAAQRTLSFARITGTQD